MGRPLHAVTDEERPEPPKVLTLAEAVESGDVLELYLAQRRFIVEKLAKAGDNTAPQLNNELNKMTDRIEAEQARRAADEEAHRGDSGSGERRSFDATAL